MTDFYPESAGGGAHPGSGPGNVPEFTVSEISLAVKRTLEGTFERVRVRGEISGFKRAASGHCYMTLKDADAVLDAVCWRSKAGRPGRSPEAGLEVIAHGRLTSHPGRSKSQPVIPSPALAGRRTLGGTFERVGVRGEISGFNRAASGHCYMTLKDADAVLDAVCWRSNAGRLGISPEDGMEVIATGRLTSYPGRSKYQIVIESLELAGEGALLKLLEDRRKKLAAEGLFDAARKRALPFLPAVIGVVTPPPGPVIPYLLPPPAHPLPPPPPAWARTTRG